MSIREFLNSRLCAILTIPAFGVAMYFGILAGLPA